MPRRALYALLIALAMMRGQSISDRCGSDPLYVCRPDDRVAAATLGTLRFAVQHASKGAVITFAPALNGSTIKLDASSLNNHIALLHDLTIQGPGSKLLTISGGGATRIFLLSDAIVHITGVTLAEGFGKGGSGGSGTGGAGGGGGAAGMGGAIFINRGKLSLRDVVFSGNRAVGGDGGHAGGSLGAGQGGGGGGFASNGGDSSDGRRSSGTGGGELGGVRGGREGIGGLGGTADALRAGEDGGWGAGGGGAALSVDAGGGIGGPGGASAFGGGAGGSAGFYDVDGLSAPAHGGDGGAALGGAIFVRSGLLELFDTTFVNNTSSGGVGGEGAFNGQAKGGALFICSSEFCGPGNDGAATWSGTVSFQFSRARDPGASPRCPGRDDVDVCGYLSAPAPTRFLVSTSSAVTAGLPFTFRIHASDANGNIVATYAGAVRIASSDENALVPKDCTLSRGVGTCSMTMNTAGAQTIGVTDMRTTSLRGVSEPITVTTAEASR